MTDFGSTVRTLTLWAMIPMHLALLVWMWLGRYAFGVVSGWMGLVLMIVLAPAAVALLITTVLSFTQPGRPRLSAWQAWTQIALWVAMFVFGAVVVDFDDAGTEQSVLTVLAGDGLVALSEDLMTWSAIVVVAIWCVLLVTLLVGFFRSGVESVDAEERAAEEFSPTGFDPAPTPGPR